MPYVSCSYLEAALDAVAPNLVDSQGNALAADACVLKCPTTAGTAGQVLTAQADGSTLWTSGGGGLTAVLHDATLTGDGNATQLSVASATDSQRGAVETATSAEIGAGAATGSSGPLVMTPDDTISALNDTATVGGTPLQKAVVNAFEQAFSADTGAQAAVAASLADDLGATAAETIAGTVANKYISPDDLKATLAAGANYPISLATTGTAPAADFSAPAASIVTQTTGTGVAGQLLYANYTNIKGVADGASSTLSVPTAATVGQVSSGTVTTGVSAGVYGSNNSASGGGTKIGVNGRSEGATGTNIGVYGTASSGNTNWAGFFEGPGYISAGSWTTSDRRLKENFSTVPDFSQVKIQSYDKYYYVLNPDNTGKKDRVLAGRQIGVIAQDVQAIAPEYVKEVEGYLSLSDTSILYALIDSLRKENAKLEARIAALESK